MWRGPIVIDSTMTSRFWSSDDRRRDEFSAEGLSPIGAQSTPEPVGRRRFGQLRLPIEAIEHSASGGAVGVCKQDAELVPVTKAAEGLVLADQFAARGVVTVRPIMRNVARASVVGPTFEIRITEVAADLSGNLGTDAIPSDLAADGVVIADVIAALFIVARWGAVREATVAGVGVPAHRHGAGVFETGTVFVGQCHACTDQIPFHVAAIGVVGADRVTAGIVVALGRPVGQAARSRTGVAAVPVGAATTAGALAGQFDADGVPGRVAARGVLGTDVFAAPLVVTTG